MLRALSTLLGTAALAAGSAHAASAASTPSAPVALSTQHITIEAQQAASVMLMPLIATGQSIHMTAVSKDQGIAFANASLTIPAHDQTGAAFGVYGAHPGNIGIDVRVESDDPAIGTMAFTVSAEVIKSFALVPWISGLGWLCFFLWSASFYPQVCAV